MNVLITGTSRGIGLEFVRQFSKQGHQVVAACRHPESSQELLDLQKSAPERIRVIQLDVEAPRAQEILISEAEKMGSIDLLMNNAGVYPEGEGVSDFEHGFRVNAIAPYQITLALLPWLRKSREPKAVFLTSMMGSIADNSSGGSVAYRASKTALNMMVRCLSISEPWLLTALLHPGWVKTRMGGPDALITTEESVRGMLQVIGSLKPENSGSFLDYEGDVLPW